MTYGLDRTGFYGLNYFHFQTDDSQLYIAQLVVHAISVATGSGYPDHLDHFLSGSKWVLPGHTYMPDQDPKYLII